MLRKLLLPVFMLILLTQSNIGWTEEFNFRHTRWGMSQADVISSEGKLVPVEKTENLIRYKTRVLSRNVELIYFFAMDKLIGSTYKLDDNFLNSQHFLSTYRNFKQQLTRKYGQPDTETTIWLDDTYRVNPRKWGLALSLGHTKYAAVWHTNDSTIESSLTEDNNYVMCLVEYKSTEYLDLFAELSKENIVDPF